MPENLNQPAETADISPDVPVPEKIVSEGDSSVRGGKDMHSGGDSGTMKARFKKILAETNAFLDSLNEENEPEPPPEKPLKESVRDFLDRWHDREKRTVMMKEFGDRCRTMLFHGTAYIILFALTIWGTMWALDFSETHRIKFFPPNEVTAYLSAEHEALETSASQLMPLIGRNDDIPFDRFDSRFIETVKPVRIYSDEYGIYFVTSKDWYNGEHGIFIAKDEENMPTDINWCLIEGRIYTYTVYD